MSIDEDRVLQAIENSVDVVAIEHEVAAEIPRLRRDVLRTWFARDPHQRTLFSDSALEELFSLAFPDAVHREGAEEKLRLGLQDVLACSSDRCSADQREQGSTSVVET